MSENLKYEQINWGWLNDYSGYKFAPITFYENLYTARGNTFKSIYEKDLLDLETGVFVVGSAKTLIEDKGEYLTPFITSSTVPVYFNDGVPVQCEELTIDLTGNINNIDNYNSYTVKAGNLISDDALIGSLSLTNKINLAFQSDDINSATCLIDGSGDFNIDISLKTTAVTAGSYGPSAGGSLSHSTDTTTASFTVPQFTVDSKGRITGASTKTFNMPQGNKVSVVAADNITKRYILTNSASGTELTDNKLTYYSSIYVGYNGSGVDSAVLMGAAWNDYAEFRNQVEEIEPGYCVASTNQGKVYKTTEKFQACDGIVSDTYGFTIGQTDECKTPLAVSGRVLAYFNGNREDYNSGDTVCAGPDGKICKMTREEIREYPDRIIGIVSEIPEYEEWNGKKVNNRIWIKVK